MEEASMLSSVNVFDNDELASDNEDLNDPDKYCSPDPVEDRNVDRGELSALYVLGALSTYDDVSEILGSVEGSGNIEPLLASKLLPNFSVNSSPSEIGETILRL